MLQFWDRETAVAEGAAVISPPSVICVTTKVRLPERRAAATVVAPHHDKEHDMKRRYGIWNVISAMLTRSDSGWMDAKHGWWTALFVGRAWADTYQGDGHNATSLDVLMRYVFNPNTGEYTTVSVTEYNADGAKVSAWLGGTFVLPSIDYTNHSGVYNGDYRYLSLDGRF